MPRSIAGRRLGSNAARTLERFVMNQGPRPVVCREIAVDDLGAIVDLLSVGFPRRHRSFWVRAMTRLQNRPVPQGYPRFGHLLHDGRAPVGVLLTIFSEPQDAGTGAAAIRCSVSSWYVMPAYRGLASMLAARAMRHKQVTYLNASPASNTVEVLEAQA